uniref:Predicted protein n=1 Tax=Hordeum vulgare subsp. vulgare TaxID=112509 RepID=F2DKV8_HORVV|nr:predicted protein [Hordeum vulgare subsp. vulgare]
MVRLCVVLAILVAAGSAQTTAGAPFNNPSFVTAFDATNAQITLTFANPVSRLLVSNFELQDDTGAAVSLAAATLATQGNNKLWLLTIPRASMADGKQYWITFINKPPVVCSPPTFLNVASSPTSTVGTGTSASCTFASLQSAIAAGGLVNFNCGPQVVVIAFTATIAIIKNVTIDGGSRVAFDGLNARRLFTVNNNPADSRAAYTNTYATFKNLIFVNGKVTSSTSGTDGGGGAIYRSGAELNIDNCVFHNCNGMSTGPDQAGGAIYSFGGTITRLAGTIVTGSSCSAGGALGSLGSNIIYYNSILSGNTAATGGGGAVYFDGAKVSLDICGVTMRKNAIGTQGTMYRTAYNNPEDVVTITKSWIDSNTAGSQSGFYFQDLKLVMKETTISNGGGPGHQFFQMGNYGLDIDYVTWYNNAYPSSGQSLGAGGVFDPSPVSPQPGATWTIKHCTVYNNSGLFSSGFLFGTSAAYPTVSNTAFENIATIGYKAVNCKYPAPGAGGVYQSPSVQLNNGPSESGSLCATGATLVSGPLGLGPLGDQGCAVPTNSLLANAALPTSVRGTSGCAASASVKVTDVVTDSVTLLPVQWPSQSTFTTPTPATSTTGNPTTGTPTTGQPITGTPTTGSSPAITAGSTVNPTLTTGATATATTTNATPTALGSASAGATKKSKGLSGGAIAGIVVGALLVIVAVTGLVVWLVRTRTSNSSSALYE